jgi:hypothetical protein
VNVVYLGSHGGLFVQHALVEGGAFVHQEISLAESFSSPFFDLSPNTPLFILQKPPSLRTTSRFHHPASTMNGPLETPLGDIRSYEHFVMSNELEVFLVHDTTTDFSSAAMNVGAGFFSEPDPDMPGTPHAVE